MSMTSINRTSRIAIACLFSAQLLQATAMAGETGVSEIVWDYLEYRRVSLTLSSGEVIVGRLESVYDSTVLIVPANGDLREIKKSDVESASLSRFRVFGKDPGQEASGTPFGKAAQDVTEEFPTDALLDAELQGTADTLPPGEAAVHVLFNRSVFGVAENVDLRAQLFGSILGPDAALRWRALSGDVDTLSVEGSGWVGWRKNSYTIGASALYDRSAGPGSWNFSAGIRYDSLNVNLDEEFGGVSWITGWRLPLVLNHPGEERYGDVYELRGFRLPVSGGYTWRPGSRTALSARVRADLVALGSGFGYLSVLHGSWSHALSGKARITLGLNLVVPGIPSSIRDRDVDDRVDTVRDNNGISAIDVLPLPAVALWWRI